MVELEEQLYEILPKMERDDPLEKYFKKMQKEQEHRKTEESMISFDKY